ncbi:hypothetical protein ADUPG1_008112 [Aduncisulcus paluster]|uniref:Uncharacterized protein n=1 Tax=Aduncisulcus paluster TaxID=2918883 RepID=A0ABQ5KQU5_9EUKA|nr:hypothetical protein ADUPG1_008112 [Aduncisulcus paluster]
MFLTREMELYPVLMGLLVQLLAAETDVHFFLANKQIIRYSISIQMSSSTDSIIQTVEPEFIHEGDWYSCPIPRDSPNIKGAAFPTIKAIDGTKEVGDEEYDQNSEAQKMMRGEDNDGNFTHISIPFSSSSPMKGAYICLYGFTHSLPPSHLIFTLISSKGDKTSKKYEFPGFKGFPWYFLPVDLPDVEVGDEEYDQNSEAQKMMRGEDNDGNFTHISIPFSSSSPMKGAYICLYGFTHSLPPSHLIFTLISSKGDKTSKKYEFPGFKGFPWYFLPVDLPDVVLCEITGKGREEEYFGIRSLVFIREETPEEIKSREASEKLWSETQVVKPEFKEVDWEDEDSIPIPRDDPKLVDPSFSIVKCKDDSRSKESLNYDQSSNAQKMLKGEDKVSLSHLSIPFPSPSPMKGAFICVDKYDSSPSLLFTFTDCDGKKTCKKYEFIRPKHWFEWHFLPIDLDNVVLCEIEGKGMWCNMNSRSFWISSLVFTLPEETIVVERLSQLPWK